VTNHGTQYTGSTHSLGQFLHSALLTIFGDVVSELTNFKLKDCLGLMVITTTNFMRKPNLAIEIDELHNS
jgi:hypothetical protein